MAPTVAEVVERAIGSLNGQLREALLLTTGCTYGRSAAILGISKGTLRERVSEAKRQVVRDVLDGEEWQDADIRDAVGMYVDAVAIRMKKQQESGAGAA